MAAELPPPPPAIVQQADFNTRIRLNTIGFLPGGTKQATVAGDVKAWQVVEVKTGAVALQGSAARAFTTSPEETDETVHLIDFSALTQPGDYRLEVPSVGHSAPFSVGETIWAEPYQLIARAMYLWRCGTAVEGTWQGQTYRQAPCHLQDGYLDYVTGAHTHRPGTGGWHDAGDYNKYVVNAGVTVGLLLKAWEHFGERLAPLSHAIPESTDTVPDLLNEVRWEVEWLFSMQADDGKVYHKLSSPDFRFWGPAEKDLDPRYFSPWSTIATADFTAMMAATARHWRAFDPAFAERCLAAARRSWDVLLAHPEQVDPDLSAFKTGGYTAKDASHRLWAAAELWETTGESAFLQAFEKAAARETFTSQGPTWGDVQDLALATYLLASRPADRDRALVARLTRDLAAVTDGIVALSQKSGYARPLGFDRKSWYWGANGTVAGQTLLLHLADRLQPDPKYRRTAEHAVAFLFGRNYHGRSYVTGLGALPPAHPHDRRGEPAWPGYLVGGGHPDGRSWKDELARYDLNEIAINWNGALLYAVAAFTPAPAAK